jgi:hypothetical protein
MGGPMLYIAIMEFFIPAIWNYALCLGVWRQVASKSHKYLTSQTFTASYPIIPEALPKNTMPMFTALTPHYNEKVCYFFYWDYFMTCAPSGPA